MSKKNILILLLLTIITLGFFWIYYNSKKNKYLNKDELSRTQKLPFPIDSLIEAIGKDNFVRSEFTHTKVKIYVQDSKKINLEKVKKLKSVSGSFSTSKFLVLIVGNSAKSISEELNNIK